MSPFKHIFALLATLILLMAINAYPYTVQQGNSQIAVLHKQNLSENVTKLSNYAAALRRLKRALNHLEFEDQQAVVNGDDLELAEINVFRPLFRYRAAVSKQIPNQQFG